MEQTEKEVQEVTQVSTPTAQQVTTTTKVVKDPQVKTEHPQVAFEKKKTIFRAYQIIWYIWGVIEVLLAFRSVLYLIGASPYSGFTNFIYALSNPFALPFSGIVAPTVAGSSTVEWGTYIGMIVYWVVAYGLVYLFQFVKPVTPTEVSEEVDTQ